MASGLRFLVVDDFSTMRRIVVNLLKDKHFSLIEEAEDGVIALQKLRGAKFDLVLCDINMPNMGGLELLALMKQDETLKHIPVLMVTAEARREEILRVAHLGAAGYVVKPFTKAVLEDRLMFVLRNTGLQP